MATLTLRPNAAGDSTNITNQTPGSGSHYDKVDDTGSGDGDTTTVWESDGTNRDLYNIPDTATTGPINNIKVYARLKGISNYQTPTGKIVVKIGGTEYASGAINPTASYVLYSNTWTDNPNTSSAWTWANIDSLQIGMELFGAIHPLFPALNTQTVCTQLYVEVDYDPFVDIGLRVRSSGGTVTIAGETLSASNKLRFRKGGTTYGIVLVATGDANASGLRIYDGAATKALAKL